MLTFSHMNGGVVAVCVYILLFSVYNPSSLVVSSKHFPSIALVKGTSITTVATTTGSNELTKSNKPKNYNQLVNFIAGGVAGTISATATIPLEVIKTQLQSSRRDGALNARQVFDKILKANGPKGFYKGLTPLLVGIVPTRAIYFSVYSWSKSVLAVNLGDTPINHLCSAFAAGISSNTIMNPLWMVKTRYQIIADTRVGQRVFTSFQDVVRTIWREEGPPGFFKGMSASYVGCFEGAIQWIAYEKVKKSCLCSVHPLDRLHNAFAAIKGNNNNNSSSYVSSSRAAAAVVSSKPPRTTLSPTEYFVAAAGSKLIAILVTYPHEVVRTRLREQATNGVFKYTGFVSTLKSIAREEGRRGLYGGMDIHILRSVPNAAIMFLSFELVSNWLKRQETLLAVVDR